MAHIDRRPGIRPRATLGRRLDLAARISFPACSTILLMLLTQAPFHIPAQAALLPAVTLNCVWFWSLSRPEALPSPIVFAMGLLMDLLAYLPPGVGVFTLLAVHGVALALRPSLSRQAFTCIWIVFAGLSALASLLLWLMVMLLTFTRLSPSPAVFTAVLTAAIFPLFAVPLGAAHQSIANPERA